MSDLKTFVTLQARLYEFLERQDETTLLAILSGEAHLAVWHGDDAQVSTPSAPPDVRLPSDDPKLVALELLKPASEDQRLIFLKAAGLKLPALKEVAKLCGLRGYSRLNREKLIDQLVFHDSSVEQQLSTRKSMPPTSAPQPSSARSNADVAAIASRLREMDTVEEGAAYLRSHKLDRESLLVLAAELQLTRVTRLSQPELEKRVLKQAIGSRRKFSGLGKW
ncbi:hypothetical protein [Amycolatopsis sp. lyj-84]|uniref:hypothetical protein n=1 Tax=Amycolatopsis sp. lyj-84 TaxID=2789284 RepID=UPI00397BB769